MGLFLIEQVVFSVAYRISLPKEYGHIHSVFHVFFLHGHHGPSVGYLLVFVFFLAIVVVDFLNKRIILDIFT